MNSSNQHHPMETTDSSSQSGCPRQENAGSVPQPVGNTYPCSTNQSDTGIPGFISTSPSQPAAIHPHGVPPPPGFHPTLIQGSIFPYEYVDPQTNIRTRIVYVPHVPQLPTQYLSPGASVPATTTGWLPQGDILFPPPANIPGHDINSQQYKSQQQSAPLLTQMNPSVPVMSAQQETRPLDGPSAYQSKPNSHAVTDQPPFDSLKHSYNQESAGQKTHLSTRSEGDGEKHNVSLNKEVDMEVQINNLGDSMANLSIINNAENLSLENAVVQHPDTEKRSCSSSENRNREIISNSSESDEQLYPDRFCLYGVPVEVKEDTLINYVEVVADCGVLQIEYGCLKPSVVVTVDTEPDWKEMQKMISKRELENHKLSYTRLLVSRSICIWDISNRIEESHVKRYFETTRSGNTERIPVTGFDIKDNKAVVTFEHASVLGSVLSQPSHEIDGKKMKISNYYSVIGPVQESSKIVREEKIKLSVGVLRLMRVANFLERHLGNLVEADLQNETTVVIKGIEKNLEDARNKIQQFKESVQQKPLECSHFKRKYLAADFTVECMLRKLREKDIHGVWVCEKGNVEIFATSGNDLGKVVNWIERHLKEKTFPVQGPFDPADLNSKLEHVQRKLDQQHEGGSYDLTLDTENKNVTIVAQHEDFFQISEQVQSFITPKDSTLKQMSEPSKQASSAMKTSEPQLTPTLPKQMSDPSKQASPAMQTSKPPTLPVSSTKKSETFQKERLRFIQRYCIADIKAIETKYATKITFEEGGKTIEIIGEPGSVEITRKYFKDIAYKLAQDIFPLGHEMSQMLLKSGFLPYLERHIEDTNKCVICHKIQELPEEKLGATGGASAAVEYSAVVRGVHRGGGHSGRGHHGGGHSGGGHHGRERHGANREYDHGHGHQNNNSTQGFNQGEDNSGEWQQPKPKSRRHRKFVHKAGIQICLKNSEIAKETADIIVNTVTPNFDLQAGPLSKSIAVAGGYKLKEECKQKKDQLKEGSYVATEGGDLACKNVFHCCLPPKTSTSAGQCVEDMIQQMLKYADVLKAKSIAIPALGTGGLKYDPGVVANTMFKCVREYSEQNMDTHIKEVRFVIYNNQSVFQAFKDVEKHFGSSENTHQTGGTPAHKGPCPKLVTGELAQQKVDVIVNTSNQYLQLNNGAVSKSLLHHGGDEIQKECDKIIKRKVYLLSGEFEVTSGGYLSCKKIYHCCVPDYSQYRAVDKLKEMVCKILERAHSFKSKSIAFPALGTGNLGYPRDEVAKTLYKTVEEFWKSYPSTTLTDVRFVIYQKDHESLKAFQNAEMAFKGISLTTHKSNSAGSGTPSSTKAPVPPPRAATLHIRSMKVKVKQGDITKENVEAIINPINPDMSLHTGSVSKALLKVGGPSFEEETKKKRERLSNERIATALMKNCVMVFHVDRNFIKADQKQAILACLKSADKLDMKTVAFPILKTGDAAEEMASDLYAALYKLPKHTAIEAVIVVIYDKAQFHKFRSQLEKLSQEDPLSKEDPDQIVDESLCQITFTLISDKRECLLQAKKTLGQLCSGKNEDVETLLKFPPSITKEDIGILGMSHDRINITYLETANHTEIRMKGKPMKVLGAIKSFHDHISSSLQLEWKYQVNEDIEPEQLFAPQEQPSSAGGSLQNLNRSPPSTEEIKTKRRETHYHGEQSGGRDLHEYEGNRSTASMDLNKHYESNVSERRDDSSDMSTGGNSMGNESHFGTNRAKSGLEIAKNGQRSPYKMKWFFIDPDTDELQAYEDDISSDIEMSYIQGKEKHDLPEDAETKEIFLIDFKVMEEYPVDNPQDKVAVIRREEIPGPIGTELPPSAWDPMNGQQVMIVPIKLSDKSYEGVKEQIMKSCGKVNVSLLKVERVQNTEMFHRYMAKKKMVETETKDKDVDQRLWYRCDRTDAIVPINNHGINLNYCRHEYGGAFGEGVYFHRDFEDVAKTDYEGPQYAYLCRVIVGKVAKGNPDLRDPPAQPADESSFYHSVVDNIQSPSTFVVFSDAQVYPNYLVTYKVNTELGTDYP